MKKSHFILAAAAIVLALTAVLVWGFIAGRSEAAADAASEQPVTPAVRVAENPLGPPTLTLTPQLQQQAGIDVRAARPTSYQNRVDAYASVLELRALVGTADALASANAQRAGAEGRVAASRAALRRARSLFEDDRNFSRAQLQAAQAVFATDEANFGAAQVQARNAAAQAYQTWGPVLGRSLASNSPLMESLLQHRQVLIQVTLPLGVPLPDPPRTAAIESVGGGQVQARLVSAAISTDPHIQGRSYFYVASATSGLLPGMNVIAHLPAGAPGEVLAIPASAVVWLHGEAWVYLQIGRNAFSRRQIPTTQPQADGGYVVAARSLPASQPLVIEGAQLLLSQEFSAEINLGD